MKKSLLAALIVVFGTASASAQSNKIVFGPLEGDDAGVLTVRNGEDIEIEVWVRTDPSNPAPIVALTIGLLSNDSIIAERNCAVFNPDYDWEYMGCDGPFRHDPDDPFPIPEGHTLEFIWAYCSIFYPEGCDTLDTGGEWDYFASFLMVCNTSVPADEIYYPFSSGWYPHSEQGTAWSFEAPPGGSVIPEQDYCRLYFEPETAIDEVESLPQEFSLSQNYPNPFNISTSIRYSLPEASKVTIEIYDILGRKVETLVSGIRPAGWHSVVWNADNQPSGIYFYRLEAGEYAESKNCLLLK